MVIVHRRGHGIGCSWRAETQYLAGANKWVRPPAEGWRGWRNEEDTMGVRQGFPEG